MLPNPYFSHFPLHKTAVNRGVWSHCNIAQCTTAVKSYLVEGFLSSNNASFEKAESTEKLELPDIAEKAEKFTVLVGCWE